MLPAQTDLLYHNKYYVIVYKITSKNIDVNNFFRMTKKHTFNEINASCFITASICHYTVDLLDVLLLA